MPSGGTYVWRANPQTSAPPHQGEAVSSLSPTPGQRGSLPFDLEARQRSHPPLLTHEGGRRYVPPPPAPRTYPPLRGMGRGPTPTRTNQYLSSHPHSLGCPTRHHQLPHHHHHRHHRHRCRCPPPIPMPKAFAAYSSSCPPSPSSIARPRHDSPPL